MCAVGGALVIGLGGCGHMKTGGARELGKDKAGRSISEAEVQEDLQRFAGQYFDRTVESMEENAQALSADQQFQLMKRFLLYDSSVLDIVSGKNPLVNLLDLMVFTALTRSRFETHWMPEVFGPSVAPVLASLRRSEQDVWGFGQELLQPAQVARLRGLIARWERDNPEQVRVEMVRLAAFSKTAGKLAAERDEVTGLLSGVKSVTQTADAAVLLGERAMFFAQRAPFLFRLQARVAAFEVTHDGVQQLAGQTKLLDRTEQLLARTQEIVERSTALLERTGELEPLVQELTELTQNARVAAEQARLLNDSLTPLAERFSPLLAPRVNARGEVVTSLEAILESSNELTARSAGLLREVRSVLPAGRGDPRVATLRDEMDRGLRRLMGYLALVGAAWATFFWGGYYLVRRRIDARGPGAPRGLTPPPGVRPSSAG